MIPQHTELPLECNLFESPAFHQCWWTHLAPCFSVLAREHDLLVYQRPVLKGLLQVKEMRLAGWNTAWSQDLTPERADCLIEFVRQTPWDCFRMTWTSRRESVQAFESLQNSGLPLMHLPVTDAEYWVDLSNGWEAYIESLGRSNRKNIRRKIKSAQPMVPTLHPVTSISEIDGFFEQFFKLHIAYWQKKTGHSYLSHPAEQAFIVDWVKHMYPTGCVILDRLTMLDDVVNMSVNVVYDGVRYALLTINSRLHADYTPGIVGLQLRLQEAATAGIRLFNQGPGNYPYKTQSANLHVKRHEVVVFNPKSILGLAYHRLYRSRLGAQ